MRKPRLEEFWDDDTGTYDYEEYEEMTGTYEDLAYDEWRDEQIQQPELPSIEPAPMDAIAEETL